MTSLLYRFILWGIVVLTVCSLDHVSSAAPDTLAIDTGNQPAIALNRSRLPVIIYSSGPLRLAVCADLACPDISITEVPGTAASSHPSVVLTSDEQPIISYYHSLTRDLMLAVCGDSGCTSATLTTIDSGGDVGQFSSVRLNSRGNPVISYYDATNGDLKLVLCDNLSCTSRRFQQVDRARDVGRFTSLRLDRLDHPVISYYDVSHERLQLAICDDPLCQSRAITNVDSVGNVGQYTSLVLKRSGLPIISYYDVTRGDLKLAICNNITCSRPTLRVMDNAGNVGQYTSLALDASEKPVISYFASSLNISRLAVCQNSTCTGVNRLDLGRAASGGTSVAVRDPQGIYGVFVNRIGRITIYVDIPTPYGCYIDAPSGVDEGALFRISVRCDGMVAPVYGFEIGVSAAGRVTPVENAFRPGSFVISARGNILEGPNFLNSYAISRRTPANAATGSFSLGTVDYVAGTVERDTSISLTLNKLLLGDIKGAMLTVPFMNTVLLDVRNLP